jgi:hypothetical protein
MTTIELLNDKLADGVVLRFLLSKVYQLGEVNQQFPKTKSTYFPASSWIEYRTGLQLRLPALYRFRYFELRFAP